MRIDRTLRLIGMATLSLALVAGLLVSPAAARRGISQAQIKALQKKMQQQQQMQQGLSKVQADRDKETMSKYDLNSNGKIDANEKPAWDKYWREVNMGKQPHPYSTITADEVSKAANPQATKTAAKKK